MKLTVVDDTGGGRGSDTESVNVLLSELVYVGIKECITCVLTAMTSY